METKQQEITLSNGVVLRQNGKYKVINITTSYWNIITYLYSDKSKSHLFIDANEEDFWMSENILLNKNIQEYREPRKVELVRYFTYDPNDKKSHGIVTQIIGYEFGDAFDWLADAIRSAKASQHYTKIAKVTINATVEYDV